MKIHYLSCALVFILPFIIHAESGSMSSVPADRAISLTQDELLQKPQLLARALDFAIEVNDIDDVKHLLHLYKKVPTTQQDQIMVLYAQAVIWRAEGKQSQAIRAYREIIAQRPDLLPVRLQMAIALAENHNVIAALDQFRKLRSQPDLPQEVVDQIDVFIADLQEKETWDISLGGQYLNDKNVNNASDDRVIPFGRGQLTLPEKESAEGIGYNFSANKMTSLGQGWNAQIGLQVNGKYYWDNQQYSDLNIRGNVGFGFQNVRSSVSVLPFYEKRWFGKQPYSETTGVRVAVDHWLTPQWQLSGTGEYGCHAHEKRKFMDGNSIEGSVTALYQASSQQYWLAGIDMSRYHAQDTSESNKRVAMRVGWGQEWNQGYSTQLQIGTAQKQYDSPGVFNILREDKEYFSNASIWRRDWHIKGITPRLTWTWNKTRSNQPLFNNVEKHQVFVEFNKAF